MVEVMDGDGETGEHRAGSSSVGTASSCGVVAVVVVVVEEEEVGIISSSLVGRHLVSNDSSWPSEFTEYVRDLLVLVNRSD